MPVEPLRWVDLQWSDLHPLSQTDFASHQAQAWLSGLVDWFLGNRFETRGVLIAKSPSGELMGVARLVDQAWWTSDGDNEHDLLLSDLYIRSVDDVYRQEAALDALWDEIRSRFSPTPGFITCLPANSVWLRIFSDQYGFSVLDIDEGITGRYIFASPV